MPKSDSINFSLRLALCLIVLLTLNFFGCASGGGTEGTWGRSFSGKIDGPGGPLAGLNVELLETGSQAITNIDGEFEFDRIELPDIDLTFKISGDNIDADVVVADKLPKKEAKVALGIKVESSNNARVDNIVVQVVASPTPTAVPPTATSVPTSAPATPTSPPAPQPSATSTATAIPTASPQPTATPAGCRGDINGDKLVDLTDLGILLSLIGLNSGDPGFIPAADLNDDQSINNPDVTIMQSIFGTHCA